MTVQEQIREYINRQPAGKRSDMEDLHHHIQELMPGCMLWFLDGKNEDGKVVSNPNIGYGRYQIQYSNGKSREFYQIGLSANTSGISLYIMGIDDKNYLPGNFGATIGKASVTGYCIKFRSLKDIDRKVLASAIQQGIAFTGKS